ncbi:MAG TPA: 50S ribosomal protein L24 [Candidatus Paceibacterota bacterium]|jgi:large subunit ribosomal protein L24|nr:50S ribosomal protein L24 [Candidatus Paceibacterota bacterium]
MKLKKGDKVVVIAGKEKGKTGTVVRVFPARDQLVLDKMNLSKKHRRATRAGGKGQIIDIAMPIHVSNVMLADPKDGKPTRIKIARKEGVRTRVAVKSGQEL